MAREVDSLTVQKQLNQLFSQRLDFQARTLSVMQDQLKIALQMKAVMDGLSQADLEERLDAGAKAMGKLADEAERVQDIGVASMKELKVQSDKASKSTSALSGALSGGLSIMKSMITTAGGIAASFFKIGKAVLSVPLKIFSNLLADAASMPIDTSFMQAIEDVRKEFGSFKEDVSKNVMGAYNDLRKGLSDTGLSVYQVFSTPAESVKYLHELFSKAGAQAHQFGKELALNAGAVAGFDKGLGIGAEKMKAFMDRAAVFGTTLQKQLLDDANYAIQLGNSFGISSKVLGRDIATMMKDVRNFGSLTQKEMSVTAVYTRKLGLEVKDLVGLVDKFDSFDKAAESAAMLSQAFGASVDAFKLMNEQDPAKRLDELRKSMAAAGKSTENMTRQELHLLAQTSGLSDEAAKLAFSTKNQGLSYDQVQKQANKAETAQLRQAQALEKLADNIERAVRAGQSMTGSFWKQFVAGFERGVKWSEAYRGTMMKLNQALRETFWAGNKVGDAFANSEKVGFGPFMKSFGNVFSPQNVRKLMYGFKDETGKQATGVVQELKDVFSGKKGLDEALTNIKSTFHKVVDSKEFEKMKESGKQMMRFLAGGLGSGSAFIMKELTKVFKDLADFIKNPKEFLAQAQAAGGGAKSFGAELIKTFTDSFGDPKIAKDFKDAFFKLLDAVGDKLMEVVTDPRVLKLMLKVGTPLIAAIFGPGLIKKLPSLIQPLLSQLPELLATPVGGAVGAVAGVALAGAALVNVNKKMDEFKKEITGSQDEDVKQMAAYGSSLLQGLTLGLIPDDMAKQIGNSLAKLGDSVFAAIQSQFGGPLTGKLKEYFSSYTKFLGKVGGFLSAVISGDNAAIDKAASEMGDSLVNLVETSFNLLIDALPKILMKLEQISYKLVGGIFSGLGGILTSIGDKLGPLGYGFKALGWTFTKLGEAASWVGDQFGKMFASFKDVSFVEFVGAAFDKLAITVEKTFVDLAMSMKGILAPIMKVMGMDFDKQLGEIQKDIEARQHSLKDVQARMQAGLEADQISKAAAASAAKASNELPQQAEALSDFNEKLGKAGINETIQVTQGVVKSINELNATLGDGKEGMFKVGEKLQRFANNSGLGKNGTYEIKNKGINLKLDLKISMDAAEVEKAIVLRKESILFDAIEEILPNVGNAEYRRSLESIKAQKGGA